jgi:ribosomal protein S18 acetylase RimI-like enzyme
MAVFDRLGERSRRLRFNGPKPCLRAAELRALASVDANRHVLVAHVEGDPGAVGVARLVRVGESAEVAFAVVDDYQHRGIGSALVTELIEHARATGVREITALVSSENRAAVALLCRVLGALEIRFDGPELMIRARLAG